MKVIRQGINELAFYTDNYYQCHTVNITDNYVLRLNQVMGYETVREKYCILTPVYLPLNGVNYYIWNYNVITTPPILPGQIQMVEIDGGHWEMRVYAFKSSANLNPPNFAQGKLLFIEGSQYAEPYLP